jgi:hypothetical protein
MTGEKSRSTAETRFQKTQRTDHESRSIVDTEREAVRNKTVRLKAQRLAAEAAAGANEPGKKKHLGTEKPPQQG